MKPDLPRHTFTWRQEGVEMGFRLIPHGSFRMGSRSEFPIEEPTHRVTISESFWMAETPVTQAQLRLWTQAEGIDHENKFEGRAEHPAETLNWPMAIRYCLWLQQTKGHELPKGFEWVCLPTEAEWEYACRAGSDSDYYSGDGVVALAKAGWFGEEWGSGSTHPVGLKAANDFLLFDLHGNVTEWCHDVWSESAYRERPALCRDPGNEARFIELLDDANSSMDSDEPRVLRGGSWISSARSCRSAYRYRGRPSVRNYVVGFRVCLVRGPAASENSQAGEGIETERAPGDGGRGTRPESQDVSGVEVPDLSKENFPDRAG